MPTKHNPEKVLEAADRIAQVWADNPTFTLGEITLLILQSKLTKLREKREAIEELRMQLTALLNEVAEEAGELASINTRSLSGYHAVFGPNSSQYEQAGGTRPVERKRSPRNPKPNP
jgi:hypothetical protein